MSPQSEVSNRSVSRTAKLDSELPRTHGLPTLVYLDQNMWIDLCENSSLQALALRAVREGRVAFPLSAAHFMETAKAEDSTYRSRLATVMGLLSDGLTIAPSDYLVPRLLTVTISRHYGLPEQEPPRAFGRGPAWAFAEELRPMAPHVADLVKAYSQTGEGMARFLCGGANANRQPALRNLKDRACRYAAANEQARLVGKPYSPEVRRRAYLAALMLRELRSDLTRIMNGIGKSFDDLSYLKKRDLRRIISVPPLDIEAEMSVGRDEFWNKKVDPNDLQDLSFLCTAIPHCDVVLTEKFWVELLKRRQLNDKYRTRLGSKLSDLEPLVA